MEAEDLVLARLDFEEGFSSQSAWPGLGGVDGGTRPDPG